MPHSMPRHLLAFLTFCWSLMSLASGCGCQQLQGLVNGTSTQLSPAERSYKAHQAYVDMLRITDTFLIEEHVSAKQAQAILDLIPGADAALALVDAAAGNNDLPGLASALDAFNDTLRRIELARHAPLPTTRPTTQPTGP